MFENSWKREGLTDVANLVLGVFLFLSPWLFGFASQAASWNAWLSGVVLAGLAIAALAAFATWEEWLSLIAGVWVAVSPWLEGFSGEMAAARLHLIVGIVVAVLSAVKLWMVYNHKPKVTA
jgi:hypothetical protein